MEECEVDKRKQEIKRLAQKKRVVENTKNTKSYIEFQKRQLELSRATQSSSQRRKVEANIERWENMTPEWLKSAKPANLPETLKEKFREAKLKPPFEKDILITTQKSSNGLFIAYSLIYGLIQSGVATPSQVKRTSVLDAYSNIHGMFEAKKWKENFFDPEAKVLLIENCSSSYSLTAPRGEEQFWQELVEFNRYQDKIIIITYTKETTEGTTFIPQLSSNKESNKSIIFKSKFIMVDSEEEEQVEFIKENHF